MLAAGLSGCARPTGDFDRAAPSVIHDRVMPAAGSEAARLRGEPVSTFNYTNDEKLLRDRAWALIRPPWAADWIAGTRVELARTRILPEADGLVPPERYYQFLRSERFRSSNARYDRVAADATGDAELVLPYCDVVLRVREADDERLRVLHNRTVTPVEIYDGAKARVWENRQLIDWVSEALRFRIRAYKLALAKLEIETPTGDRVWKTNVAIRTLEGQVRVAENGCVTQNRFGITEPPKTSRIYTKSGQAGPKVVK
ncbi:hypothetical protein [Roseibium sp. RKSG952]|uniref:hypothetical protein n=1 Tax=Roseibium sp. RKSG952 TaxID=2529384 RepID=UPI0034CD4987